MEPAALPPFPRKAAAPARAMLDAAGVRLRPAVPADLDFLRRLHAQWRMPELLFLPWTAAEKQAFVDDQFRLQHLHLVRHYARADFWVILDAVGQPIGRLYLDRSGAEWRLVDILLATGSRGARHGTRLIEWIQGEAVAARADLALHVAVNNPRARALYLRLGFVDTGGGDGMHLPMLWRAPPGR